VVRTFAGAWISIGGLRGQSSVVVIGETLMPREIEPRGASVFRNTACTAVGGVTER